MEFLRSSLSLMASNLACQMRSTNWCLPRQTRGLPASAYQGMQSRREDQGSDQASFKCGAGCAHPVHNPGAAEGQDSNLAAQSNACGAPC